MTISTSETAEEQIAQLPHISFRLRNAIEYEFDTENTTEVFSRIMIIVNKYYVHTT
jgi:hypothetical protein